ncbi:hypothetical protein EMGBD1_07450 [Anaerolineaceae bacterium]|nr:hypothetical protein EMGBD1_07450 [Anaerolineaceae bacterium]
MTAEGTQSRFGLGQVAIVVLALATALIHIWLAIPETMVAFYLNGAGYIALVIALYLPLLSRWKRLARILLIGYTLLTIVLWLLIGEQNLLAYADKLVEVLLVILLVLEWRQATASVSIQDRVQ